MSAVIFQIGDLVVPCTDLDAAPGMITGIIIRAEGHSYFASWNQFGGERHHFEHELFWYKREKEKRFIGFTATPP